MAEDVIEKPVKVTAEERPYPAVQKIARACIMFARQLIALAKDAPSTNGDAASSEEYADD